MKNTVIRFRNMKAVRVGKGIKELRRRSNLSAKQLADKCRITESHLNRLEDGCELEVELVTLENIAEAVGVYWRGTLTPEEVINQFLDVGKEHDQPLLI